MHPCNHVAVSASSLPRVGIFHEPTSPEALPVVRRVQSGMFLPPLLALIAVGNQPLTPPAPQCRKRKVRCDTTLPKCRNCVLRNEPCATSDPRAPDKGPTIRSVAAKGAHVPGVRQPPTPNSQGCLQQSVDEGDPRNRSEAPRNPQGTRDVAQTQPSDAEGDLSWVSRAYQESAMENQCESLSGSTPDVVINTDDTTAYKVKASSRP